MVVESTSKKIEEEVTIRDLAPFVVCISFFQDVLLFRVKVFAQKHDETCMFPLQRNTKNIYSGLYIGACRISMHIDIYIYNI